MCFELRRLSTFRSISGRNRRRVGQHQHRQGGFLHLGPDQQRGRHERRRHLTQGRVLLSRGRTHRGLPRQPDGRRRRLPHQQSPLTRSQTVSEGETEIRLNLTIFIGFL